MDYPLLLQQYDMGDHVVELFAPEREAIVSHYNNGIIPFPYWSQVWPAAIALARFIIRHPRYTRDKQVLELAAGLGLPSVVAAGYAAAVVASDYAEAAVSAMNQTVVHNRLHNMQVRLLDWYTLPANLAADVLLLSDISYDDTLFALQEKVIRQMLRKGTVVIISTPQRLIAKEAVLPLLPFCIHQEESGVAHKGRAVSITIMVLQQTG